MSKIARLTVTLPLDVYRELDRRVEYETKDSRNRTYGDLSTEDILYDAIECNYDEWSRLLEKGYKNAKHRNGIQFHNITEGFRSISKDLTVDSIHVETNRRTCVVVMTLHDNVLTLDDDTINDLLGVIINEVFEPSIEESIEFETTSEDIPECVVHLSLDDYISVSKLQYEIVYDL
jgi:metal-responsive CopG/Arc/MetJ family transcriptional regulator